MIEIDSGPFGRDEWTRAVSAFRDLTLLQTWEFGAAKAAEGGWRVDRLLIRQDNRVVAAAQIMVRLLPVVGGGLAWCNRGPLWRPASGAGLSDVAGVLSALRDHYAPQGFYVRIAPATAVNDPPAEEPSNLPPGFAATGRPGWSSAMLDLSPTMDQLRARLVGKWRNHLSKAERSGMTVDWGTDEACFRTFLDAHRKFLAERAIPTTVTPDMLQRLYEYAPPEFKPVSFIARKDGQVVGAALMARYGGICEYLAGNGTEAGRRMNSGHLLLWRALGEMRALGDRACDLSGMDSLRTPRGILEFKTGLRGEPYRLAEEIETCPRSPLAHLVRWRVRKALAAADGL